jgi:hypothetical protein
MQCAIRCASGLCCTVDAHPPLLCRVCCAGAGKTTSLSILAGRQRATSGAAFVSGAPAGSAAARAALGYCPQARCCPPLCLMLPQAPQGCPNSSHHHCSMSIWDSRLDTGGPAAGPADGGGAPAAVPPPEGALSWHCPCTLDRVAALVVSLTKRIQRKCQVDRIDW